jgi:HNH endonuclease
MTKYQDVTGKRYERLTAIRMTQSTRPTKWLCRCDCGNEKSVTLGDLNSGHTRSCGCLRKDLLAAGTKKPASYEWHIDSARRRIEERSMPEPNSGCWLWLGSINNKGYGKMSIGSRITVAHRASFEAFVCAPGNLSVLHHCDTPSCVNPEHLYIGTQQDNIDDCIRRGRFRPGGKLYKGV